MFMLWKSLFIVYSLYHSVSGLCYNHYPDGSKEISDPKYTDDQSTIWGWVEQIRRSYRGS